MSEPNFQAMVAYSKQQMLKDRSGHGFDHIERVVNMTKRLLMSESEADPMVTLTAAYLHDTIDDKVVADPQSARDHLKQNLLQWHYSDHQISLIFEIITHMSFSDNLKHHYQLPIEGQIVQDADRLDAIGAIGIIRAAYYSGHVGEIIYDPKIKPRTQMNKKAYRHQESTLINHFYEKLFKLKNYMNTISARKIAWKRQNIMVKFMDEFKAEWQGNR